MSDATFETLDRKERPAPSDGPTANRSASANPRPRSKLTKSARFLVLPILALGAVSVGGWYYYVMRDIETTDDAQTAGNTVNVAPKVSGQVMTLAIHDNERVKAGQLLLKIDPRDLIAAREQARGALAMAEAQLRNAEANLDIVKVTAPAKLVLAKAQMAGATAGLSFAQSNRRRQDALTDLATTKQNKEQALSQDKSAQAQVDADKAQIDISNLVTQTIDQAQAQVAQAKAQVEQAKGQLAQAELNLAYTEVRAPQDGWVTNRNVQVGSYVQTGQALLALVTPDVWINANFKENQLNRMRAGQTVKIHVDAYRGLDLVGHVEGLQMGTGSVFSAFPAENATGNFVKIVQRVPVKVHIDSGLDPELPLPLGLSVEPTVELR